MSEERRWIRTRLSATKVVVETKNNMPNGMLASDVWLGVLVEAAEVVDMRCWPMAVVLREAARPVPRVMFLRKVAANMKDLLHEEENAIQHGFRRRRK